MRIVVSGSHATGKSTLISDFQQRHPEYEAMPDPFELIDESQDTPGAAMFAAQLRVAADRLNDDHLAPHVIAERGPLDFLAYLLTLAELRGDEVPASLYERAVELTTEAMSRIELLVILPIEANEQISLGPDELPDLRLAMNAILLDLVQDDDLTGHCCRVAELTGPPAARLALLERLTGAEQDSQSRGR